MSRGNYVPAFPVESNRDDGISMRDWFATFAPEPKIREVLTEMESDRLANPHNVPYKPARRTSAEVRADLRYRYADAMIARRRL